jgi:hypothetical protein
MKILADFVNKIYPFTTESITGYMNKMDMENKSVLTVGSSIDHALSACLYGSKDITLIDISEQTLDYLLYKIDAVHKTNTPSELYRLITSSREFVYDKDELFGPFALKSMCPYMKDEESYQSLKEKLDNISIKYVHGSIFDMDNVLGDNKYDRMILSNVLQYCNQFRGNIPLRDFIRMNFEQFCRHLNDDGILQLLYIYNYSGNIPLDTEGFRVSDILLALHGYYLNSYEFPSGHANDAVLTYTKK